MTILLNFIRAGIRSCEERLSSLARMRGLRDPIGAVRVAVWCASVLVCLPGGLSQVQSGGSARPEFEVASIRPSPRSGSYAVAIGRTVVPDRLTMLGKTPKDLIMWAYGLKAYQISGPSWIAEEWYDVNAKAAEPASEERMRAMLQSLLAQRFSLVSHVDTRSLPIYLMAVAKNGPKIKPVESEDTPKYFPQRRGLRAVHITMQMLAERLSDKLDRPVTDTTGLRGAYDIKLEWAPDETVSTSPDPAAVAVDLGPAIFTAIQEQLGLKLEPAKGPVEMFVIDRIERPSQN
jgi:uncharacterized protein (TIGR03435 family)